MPENSGDYTNEIEHLQSVVGKYFPIYKTEVEYDVLSFYIRAYRGEDIEDRFDDLRNDLVPQNYIPYLREDNGEYFVSIQKKEDKDHRGLKTNIVMLFITIATTIIAGTFWWSSYDPQGSFFSIHNMTNGALYFALPLLTILGTHEMGHYLTAMRHKINSSLPFFIPAPPPLGTIGAFISMRDPIPDKKSLMDVGVAGPFAGLIVAIPVSILGLWLGDVMPPTAPVQPSGAVWNFHFPLVLQFLSYILPFGGDGTFHPTLFAGWVGFLVTGLNLLPAGQLDGGHVVRAMLGEKSKYASYIAVAFLVVVGIWKYMGWLIFAFFILFLVGLKHPPPLNDFTDLGNRRKAIGVVAVVVLLVSFHPVPIEQQSYQYDFDIQVDEPVHQNITFNESAVYTITVTNTGSSSKDLVNISDEYTISYTQKNGTWRTGFYVKYVTGNDTENGTVEWREIDGNETYEELDKDENRTYRLVLTPIDKNATETQIDLNIESNITGMEKDKVLKASLVYDFEASVRGDAILIENIFLMRAERESYRFNLSLNNMGRMDDYEITSQYITNDSWDIYLSPFDENLTEDNLTISVEPQVTKQVAIYLTSEQPETRGVEFYRTRASVENNSNIVVSFEIKVTSMGVGEVHTIELVGVMP